MAPAVELQPVADGGAGETGNPPVRVESRLLELDGDAQDEALLVRLGKRQVLKRNFDLVSMFAFTCLALISWAGFYLVFVTTAFVDGGQGSVIYGFLVIFIGTLSTFVSIGELSSIAPTAGGQYHWVYMLCPVRSRKLLSYLTGWMTLLSWQALFASTAFSAGIILNDLLILNYPSYRSRPWSVIFYNWGWIAVAVLANTVGSILLPIIQIAFLLIHVLAFIAVFIVLCYVTPHGSIEQVFAAVNGGNWPTQGLSTLVGLTSMVFAFLGADAAVHMSEEIHNASVNVPRSMIVSVMVNGLMGIAVVVPTVFGLAAIDPSSLASDGEYFSFVPMFRDFTGNKEGGTVICSLILALFSSCLTCTATITSRMIWAFSRDRALPFSGHLSKIDRRTSGPLNAVLLTAVISCLLLMVTLKSDALFNSLVSLGIAGFYSTYLACSGLLLWHRVRGNIEEPHEAYDNGSTITDIYSGRLAWGPWRVKGWLGTANNTFACVYLLFLIFFSLWPTSNDTDAVSMNYSIGVVALVLACSLCYYLLVARRRYSGPVVEIVL